MEFYWTICCAMRRKRHGRLWITAVYNECHSISEAVGRFFQNSRGLLREDCITTHMGNRRSAGRMRPSTSFDPALIHFSELTHIKLTSYDLRKTNNVFSHQGLFCDSWKFGYRFKTLYNIFKRGSVSNKWWSADHGLASLVDTLALITWRIPTRKPRKFYAIILK
jgi:hypothetical protein